MGSNRRSDRRFALGLLLIVGCQRLATCGTEGTTKTPAATEVLELRIVGARIDEPAQFFLLAQNRGKDAFALPQRLSSAAPIEGVVARLLIESADGWRDAGSGAQRQLLAAGVASDSQVTLAPGESAV